MLIKVNSAATSGIDTIGVDVEVNVASRGFPTFEIVGLPNKAVAESKERVKTALQNSGIDFPNKKIIVNLAPADLPKEGSFYDLPMAIGIISLVLEVKIPENYLFFGELSLDGGLRHTKGALLFSLYAKDAGFRGVFLPKDCVNEAKVISELSFYPVCDLRRLLLHLRGEELIIPVVKDAVGFGRDYFDNVQEFDFCNVRGQEHAKRALEIAAAGGHNILMIGPPGVGKTMLAKAFTTILPPLNEQESLEVTKIYSISGKIPPGGSLIKERQCRSPHHTISNVGLIGGGTKPKPGEISLAHRGVLFLDEFSEFRRDVKEVLRQPLEEGLVIISRSSGSVMFPAKFTLVAASNPCACGYLGHPVKRCICSERQVENYRKKLSGPVLDRIDLHVNVSPVEIDKLSSSKSGAEAGEKSFEIRNRVLGAQGIQNKRYGELDIFTNSELTNPLMSKYCPLTPEVEALLKRAVEKFHLSARVYFKLIKVARTIADLDQSEHIQTRHMAEAIQYRGRG